MRIVFAVGIIAGLAVASTRGQEGGCDGPVLVPGSTSGSCACTNAPDSSPSNISGGCIGGPVTVINDYTACGGSGYTYCDHSVTNVGSVMQCIVSNSISGQIYALMMYDDCLVDCGKRGGVPCSSCPALVLFCNFNTCIPDPTTGVPVSASVLTDLGDFTGCVVARLQILSSPRTIELALAILREQDK